MAPVKLTQPTDSICTFCLKNDPNKNLLLSREQDNVRNRQCLFIRLVNRYCHDHVTELLAPNSAIDWRPECCLECFKIVETYCDLYHILKCRELELNLQLDKMRSIMKHADENPTRVSEFRDWCLMERKNMEDAMKFRRKFRKQCELSISRQYPKVKVHRIPNNSINTSMETSASTRNTSNQIMSDRSDLRIISTTSVQPVATATSLPVETPRPFQEQGNNDTIMSSPVPSPLPDSSPNSPISLDDLSLCESVQDSTTQSNQNAQSQPEISLGDEPPCKKLKLSSDGPNDANHTEIDNDINKKIPSESPVKQISIDTSDSLVIPGHQKAQGIFLCNLCKATFTTTFELDEHLSKCGSNSHNNHEIINTPTPVIDISDDDKCDGNSHNNHGIVNTPTPVRDISNDDKRDGNSHNNLDIVNSPVIDNSDDENTDIDDPRDPDWAATADENKDCDEDHVTKQIPNSGRKKSKPKKVKSAEFKTSSVVKPTGGVGIPVSNVNMLCNKCVSQPHFSTLRAFQRHHRYCHTNGYSMMSRQDQQILRLTPEYVKLCGIRTSPLKLCSETFPNCRKKFLTAKELKNHKKYHGDFTCDTCDEKFDHAVDMARHQIDHFKDTTYGSRKVLCGQCDYVTFFKKEFIDHYLVMHMDKPAIKAVCRICKEKFKHTEKVPMLHYMNFHDLGRLENSSTGICCEVTGCSAYFLTEDQLHQHRNKFHVCKSAGNNGPTADADTASTKVPLEYRKLPKKKNIILSDETCTLCQKKFKSLNSLKAHTLYCQHGKKKDGKACKKIQLTEDGLTVDEFITTDNQYICWDCGKVLGNKDQLERHRTHHGEFKCNFCDVVKTMATELALHEVVHTDGHEEPGFKCPRCPFTTKFREDFEDHHLETHLNLDNDKKRCPICRKQVPLSILDIDSKLREWITRHYLRYHQGC